MIVRNIHDEEVLDTTYIAHGGAIAQMILEEVDIKIFRKDVAELLAYVEKVLTIPYGQRGERAFKWVCQQDAEADHRKSRLPLGKESLWILTLRRFAGSSHAGPEELLGIGVIPPRPLGVPLGSDDIALSDKSSYDPARPEVV
jgi:hypothetical protein